MAYVYTTYNDLLHYIIMYIIYKMHRTLSLTIYMYKNSFDVTFSFNNYI